jgi:uncharacterized protein YoxC
MYSSPPKAFVIAIAIALIACVVGVTYAATQFGKNIRESREETSELSKEFRAHLAQTDQDDELREEVLDLRKRVKALEAKVEKISKEADQAPAVVVSLDQLMSDFAGLKEKHENKDKIQFSEIERVLSEIRGTWPTLDRAQKDVLATEAFDLFAGTSILEGFSGSQTDQVWAVLGDFEEF